MSALSKVSRELEFALLGGNRPDVEVTMAVVMSLADTIFTEKRNEVDDQPGAGSTSENSTWSRAYGSLPPDVLDQALATACIPTVTTTALTPLTEIQDMCRLRPKSLDDVQSYCSMITSVENCEMVYSIDLRGIENLSRVGHFFVAGCTELRSLQLPKTLSIVGDYFLSGCSKLLKLDLSNTTISSIGNDFLKDCRELRAMRLPAELSSVEDNFLGNCLKLSRLDMFYTKLSSVGHRFLCSCVQLSTVEFPATLSSVGDEFLIGCLRQLSELDLKSTKISSVGNDFATYCKELRTILLPATLSSVGSRFLSACGQLSELDLSGTQLCTVGQDFLFGSREQCCVRMPDSLPMQSNMPSEWWSNATQSTETSSSRHKSGSTHTVASSTINRFGDEALVPHSAIVSDQPINHHRSHPLRRSASSSYTDRLRHVHFRSPPPPSATLLGQKVSSDDKEEQEVGGAAAAAAAGEQKQDEEEDKEFEQLLSELDLSGTPSRSRWQVKRQQQQQQQKKKKKKAKDGEAQPQKGNEKKGR